MTYSFSDNIQRGIIYLAKSDKEFLVQCDPIVKSSYFEFPQHQRIWSVLTSHYQDYGALPTDEAILEGVRKSKTQNELMSDYKEELQAINSLDERSIDNSQYYLDTAEEFAKEQSLKEAILESVDYINKKQFTKVEDSIRSALSVSRNVDLGVDYFLDIGNRWAKSKDQELVPKYRTPFQAINTSLDGGLCGKELAMVVAPPGVGKSLFLANQAVQSVVDGHDVLYISLEMSEDRVAQRLDSIFTRIKQKELPNRVADIETRIGRISKATTLGRLRIKEFPTKRANVTQLRAFINQLQSHENFNPDLVIIDYLELMASDTNSPEYQNQERQAQELRGLAIELDCLVWTATQTNREGKRVKIITDAELADSYGKTRVCDLVFSVNQTEEEFDEGLARLFIIKSRNGKARFLIPAKINYSTLVLTEDV
mgnify:FL=1|tara:strand:+ start:5567 stop:6844 length:1278 start_codon:yes stop_codon:yes gene_type:complete